MTGVALAALAWNPLLWNRYVYVGDDPINFVDPSGLSWQSKLKCIGSNIANGIADFISGRSGDAGSATGALWFGAGVLSGSGVRMIYIAAVLGSGGWVIVGTIALLGGATLGFIALYRDVASCWD